MAGVGKVAVLAIVVGLAAGSASAGIYSVDDGSAEGNLGFNAPGDFWWANGFTSTPAREIISISYMFITADQNGLQSNVAPGSAFKLLIYNDPNNDGNPINATLLREIDTTVGALDVFHTVSVPKTVVGSTFFIGALFTQTLGASGPPPTQHPAARDLSTSPGVSWILGSVDPIDPANLADVIGTGVLRMNDYGANYTGVFMLRAEAVPEPGTLALLGVGGLLLTLGARRARRRRA